MSFEKVPPVLYLLIWDYSEDWCTTLQCAST